MTLLQQFIQTQIKVLAGESKIQFTPSCLNRVLRVRSSKVKNLKYAEEKILCERENREHVRELSVRRARENCSSEKLNDVMKKNLDIRKRNNKLLDYVYKNIRKILFNQREIVYNFACTKHIDRGIEARFCLIAVLTQNCVHLTETEAYEILNDVSYSLSCVLFYHSCFAAEITVCFEFTRVPILVILR